MYYQQLEIVNRSHRTHPSIFTILAFHFSSFLSISTSRMTRFASVLSLIALGSISTASIVRQNAPTVNKEAAQAAKDTVESVADALPAGVEFPKKIPLAADSKPADSKPADSKPAADAPSTDTSAKKPTVEAADGDAETSDEALATTGPSTRSTDSSPEAADDDEGVCFPADATVELENGFVIKMSEVAVGDVVKVGVNDFSRVFMFTHKKADTTNQFVSLRTSTGEIELTSGHYLYVNGALAAASTVNVGDSVTLASGAKTAVEAVGSVSRAGLYNPQTVSGNVVVNGVLASTYTTAVEPTFAHAVLSPFRMLANLGVTFTNLESGGGAMTSVAPKGAIIF